MTTNEPQPTNDDIKSELVKIKKELVNTKELMKKADGRANAQFYLTFAVGAMLGAYELKSTSSTGALIIYILAIVLLVAAVLKYFFGFDWIPD
jgi:hypothetical protein